MDSSDTDDYFESADEDLSSDEAQHAKIKHSKSSITSKSQKHTITPKTLKSVQVSNTNASKLIISNNDGTNERTIEQPQIDIENNTLTLESSNCNKYTTAQPTNDSKDIKTEICNTQNVTTDLYIDKESDSCTNNSITELIEPVKSFTVTSDAEVKSTSEENIVSNFIETNSMGKPKIVETVHDITTNIHDTVKQKTIKVMDNNDHRKSETKEDTSKVTDDMWGEGDGWGWNDHKTADQANDDLQDENMWGDNEGWDVKDVATSNTDHSHSKNNHATSKKELSNVPTKTEVLKTNSDNLWDETDDWEAAITSETIKQSKEVPEDNLWHDEDNWGIENVKNKTSSLNKITESDSTWGGWGNWGISSVLSTAANITTSVSQGLTTVLETGIGVPNPEELARQHKAEKETAVEQPDQQNTPTTFGLGNFVSSVSTITKLVESTSTKVISGGLDTLETIGKKTMEVLQENDPGLKKKRAFLKIDQDKPVLSQILREAKAKAEEDNKECIKRHVMKKANYETVFDDYQGLVHLEALEMLSKQCDIKLELLLAKCTDGDDLQETMDQVKELCELPEEDEDEILLNAEVADKIQAAVADVNIPVCYNKFLSTWEDTEKWICDLDPNNTNSFEIHQHAIESLAQLTAFSVEQFHKAGELLLIKEHRSTADEADSLVQLTVLISSLINKTAARLAEKLLSSNINLSNKDELNNIITTIFFEAANSSRYVEDAFQLLIPVLQVGAL